MSNDVDPRLLGEDGDDPGCETCLARLHVWAEAVRGGVPPDIAEPQVAIHLRNCPDCAEDAEGVLALLTDHATDA
jgi:hypothetical protein